MSLAALNLNQYEPEDNDEVAELEEVKFNFLNWLTEARNLLEAGSEKPNELQPMDPAMATDPSMMPPVGPDGMPMDPNMGQLPPMMAQGMGPPMTPVPENAGLGTPINPNLPI